MAKKKVVSISLDTGKVIATRYEDISEENRQRLSDLQDVYFKKFLRDTLKEIRMAERC